MRRALIATLFSLALLPAALLSARTAQACSCMGPLPPVEAARDVDVVFHSKLVSITDLPKDTQHALNYRMFTFEVVRTFKGQLDARVNVRTADNGAACGRDYGAPGDEWLIYARIDDKGQTYDNLCSRSKPIADAAADIAELEANAGTLDQPNEPPPEPVGASEPEPIVPAQPTEPEPAPVEPSKKGCSINGEITPVGSMGLMGLMGVLGFFGMGYARRRR